MFVDKKNRWTLLKHIDAPDDPAGLHFDLLLQDSFACRTWRLDNVPVIDGPWQIAISLPDHHLDWLDRQSAVLTRGRGRVDRVFAGFFEGELPSTKEASFQIFLYSPQIEARLTIQNGFCSFTSIIKSLED